MAHFIILLTIFKLFFLIKLLPLLHFFEEELARKASGDFGF